MSRYSKLQSSDAPADLEDSGSSHSLIAADTNEQVLFERPSLDFDQVPLQASSSAAAAPQPEASSSSSSTPAARTSSQSRVLRSIGGGLDGVFSRLAGFKNISTTPPVDGIPEDHPPPISPTGNGKVFEEIEPPSYSEAVREASPPYFETTVITSLDDGDVLIEGFPVGNLFTFITNMIVSMSFDFIGFLLTALLSTSHAAKHGARAGLGITLIRYGLYIKTQDIDDEMAQYRYYNPEDDETREEVQSQNDWTAYLFIIIGFFVLLRANAEFIRVQRLRAVVLSASEGAA